MDFQAGEVLLIHKPLHWTSFDVVNKIRIMLRNHLGFRKIKVGHAGTLDPLATGLVVVCTGRATKRIESFMGQDKTYEATIRLGATTPSFDLETGIDAEFPYAHITKELVFESIQNYFSGAVEQVPPIFSAVKLNGKRAYEAARKGDSIELASRTVVLHRIEILDFQLPLVKLRIRCSKGTYIRAIARDLGQALQSGGHLVELIRTASGDTTLDQASSLDAFEDSLVKWKQNSAEHAGVFLEDAAQEKKTELAKHSENKCVLTTGEFGKQ